MTITYRRLASASLDSPISDPNDRATLPMSTLISSDQWLIEAAWDGCSIGDIQVFKNKNTNVHGARELGPDGKTPKPFDWYWWGAAPHGKIKSYKFEDTASIRPMTVPSSLSNAERKAKSQQDGASGPPAD